jgi:hypothetical protein
MNSTAAQRDHLDFGFGLNDPRFAFQAPANICKGLPKLGMGVNCAIFAPFDLTAFALATVEWTSAK